MQPSFEYPSSNATPGERQSQFATTGGTEPANIAASLWRYRWAVVVPTIMGMVCGLLVFMKTPETFQSFCSLMVESSRPAVVDTMTGDVVGGVPTIDILRSQLFSDSVVENAFNHEQMASYRPEFSGNWREFAAVAKESLRFNAAHHASQASSSMVAGLSFESTNAEVCEASVKSFSSAIQNLFAEKHKSSRSELLRLISVATDQLQPKMEALEKRYREFRTTAPLVWNEDGIAINPHRERQLFLTERRSELFEQLRSKSIELTAIETISREAKDPTVSLSIIGQLIGKTFEMAEAAPLTRNMREGDVTLAQNEVDQQLVPLMIERNKYAAQFGDSHPTVKALDDELTLMKKELTRLVTEQSKRIVELMEENKVEGVDPIARARDAVGVILIAKRAEVDLLTQQIDEVDLQISTEKTEAIELAKYEQENMALLREIDRTRELINQLEEQMARVELTEEDGGVQVSELTAPTSAIRVGPSLARMLAIGTFLGIALGCGIAFLLEKNANTFRDPDEIVAAIGAPILTHVPFFKGKVRRGKKEKPNPFETLDAHLAVVHNPASVPAEAIRSCRTSIFFETAGIKGGKVIQVTSPLPGDGKSTIAGNLACSIAQSGKKTLLIDCDLRRPQISDNFVMAEEQGLIDLLNGDCEPGEACHDTPLATLKMMPSGPIPANPAEALTLPEMSEMIEVLRMQYDFIILDTPPLLVVTDPSIVAGMVDGVVMALKVRRKSKPNTKEASLILRNVGARLLGVVINNSDEAGSSDGYKGYGYYRYGRHTSRYYRKTPANGAKAGQRRSPVVVSGRMKPTTPRSAAPITTATPLEVTQVNGTSHDSE